MSIFNLITRPFSRISRTKNSNEEKDPLPQRETLSPESRESLNQPDDNDQVKKAPGSISNSKQLVDSDNVERSDDAQDTEATDSGSNSKKVLESDDREKVDPTDGDSKSTQAIRSLSSPKSYLDQRHKTKDWDWASKLDFTAADLEVMDDPNLISPFRIYVPSTVIRDLWGHVTQDTRTEVGGVLFGSAAQDNNGCIFVKVIGIARADTAEGTLSSLKVTSDSLDSIHKEHEENFAGSKLIGWYHSHPGHGVFLSSVDEKTFALVYPQRYQIAVVLDPISGDVGFFTHTDEPLKSRRIQSVFITLN